jgi:hypothetical protein
MDMTNFLKQSKLNSQNGHKNLSNTNLNYTNQDLKKKASSLDSINAVERELDEVLKDLELNSQDLNDQLQETEYQQMCTANNSIELPINIQKSMKIDSSSSASNSCSSPSNSMNRNKWNSNEQDKNKQKSMLNSEFLVNGQENDLYLDDNLLIKQANNNKYQMKSNEELNKKFNMNNNNNNNSVMVNGVRKQRQNIISTYELCNECFDSNLLLSNPDGSRQSPMVLGHHSKCCKNNKSNCSDFNYNNNNGMNKPINGANNMYHQQQGLSPIKFATSNQDLSQAGVGFSPSPYSFNGNNNNNNNDNSPYFHGRPRPPLAQINESIIPDNKSMPLIRSNNSTSIPIINGVGGSNLDLNKTNGMIPNHVISQKVITIGIPKTNGSNNKNLAGDQSPSPKLNDSRSKSIPVPKMNGGNHMYNNGNNTSSNVSSKDEDKLDKLPPVPPSAWSTNPANRRRNQQQGYGVNGSNGNMNNNNNNRMNKLNGSKQNINSQRNENYESNQHTNGNGNDYHKEIGDENQAKLNELSIQESGSSSVEEEDSINNNNNGSNNNNNNNNNTNNKNNTQINGSKNYDNFDLNDNSNNDDRNDRIETTINKDPRYRDFGFSISDNLFGQGIFINKIRNGSPAELNPLLLPFSQIYKVRSTKLIFQNLIQN